MSPDLVATDLHGHTVFSDGRHQPEALVTARADLGMEVVAVSDHDVFAGVARAAAAAARRGVTLVPAMEVTSFIHFGGDDAEQIHILAYFPPARLAGLDDTALGRRAARVQARWQELALTWLGSLPGPERRFVDPTGELAGLPAGEFPALQPFLDLLYQRNPLVYEEFRRHHVRFWNHDRELFGWSPEQAIECIRGDGALDVVAHPNRVRDKGRMAEVIAAASGIEVYTSRHVAEVAARFRALADDRGMHWTASSDDHGHATYVRPASGTPRRTIERILG
jgi:3',5'-nucleoside bisphosphate phosphatase